MKLQWTRKNIVALILIILIFDTAIALTSCLRLVNRLDTASHLITNVHVTIVSSQGDLTVDIGFHEDLPFFGILPKKIYIELTLKTPYGDIHAKVVKLIYTLWFKHYYHVIRPITSEQMNYLKNSGVIRRFTYKPYNIPLGCVFEIYKPLG